MRDCFWTWDARPDPGHNARGKWGGDASFMNGFFGAEGRPRGRWRGGRMFEQGDLRYVILRLLEEKPRHGYEIIKALEEKFGGAYAPSPGTVYPTLQLLEDLGYARIIPGPEGKKVYEITDEGRAHLAENKPLMDDILGRISEFAQNVFGEPMMEVHRGFKNIGRSIYAKNTTRTPEQIKKIVDILQRAVSEIDAV